MATTERGIYYQDDYTKAADILADMKKTAESTDDAIKKSEYNDKDVKDSIKEIQDKQTLQDKNIENIQTKNTEQDKLIQKLQNNMIQESTEEATSLQVKDASDLPARLNVVGNHYQEQQEGTANLAILNEGIIEQNGVTVDIKEGNIKINGTNTTTNTLLFKVGTVKLIEGETYYFKRFGTVNGTGLYVNNSGTQTWGQSSETSFIAKATGTFGIVLTVGTSTINNTIQQILVSKISGRNWIEGKVPIPSVEYPSEISTVKDNIKIIIDNDNSEQKEYNLVVQQEMLQNDKFDLLNNKEVHIWKKIILNGTENWQQSSVYNNVFYLVINDMMTDINKAELISNQYKYGGYITDTAEIQNDKCYTYKQYQFTNNKAVYVRNDNFTTLESFKASLAEKNMTLYYVSDTTTELDLTEEQKETLNQLNNLELFKGVNNIYTEQDLALLQLNYTADTKMYIDNKIASIAGGN